MAGGPDIATSRGYLLAVCLTNVGVYCAAIALGLLGPSPKLIGNFIILAWMLNIALGVLLLPVAIALAGGAWPTGRRLMRDATISVLVAVSVSTTSGVLALMLFYGLIPAIFTVLGLAPSVCR